MPWQRNAWITLLRRDRGASCTQNIGDLDAPKEHHS